MCFYTVFVFLFFLFVVPLGYVRPLSLVTPWEKEEERGEKSSEYTVWRERGIEVGREVGRHRGR